jgi:pterin-4a-carbinolamine dehydratase
MKSLLKEIMQDYQDKALTIQPEVPIKPLNRRIDKFPIFPTTRWNEIDNKLRKRFTFINAETLLRFINELTEYSEECHHYGVITINKRTVDITVWTRQLSIITEIDKEFATNIDEIYKNIIEVEIMHNK